MPDTQQTPDQAALDRLDGFLRSHDCPPGSLSLEGIDGLLFANACSPDPAQPTQWLAVVFGGSLPELGDEVRAEDVMGTLLRMNSEITERVKNGSYALPELCRPREPAVANLVPEAPLQQWSRGFDLGHARTSTLWDQLLPREHSEELGTCLLALSFWADTEAIRQLRQRSAAASELPLEDLAERLVEILPTAVDSYAAIGRSIANALSRRGEQSGPAPARSDKVGRNDPCPCGSGRKYKKCCGAG